MTGLDVLIAARKLLTPRKAWTQGAWFRDANGKALRDDGVRAVCFCLSGALIHCSKGSNGARYEARSLIEADKMAGGSVLGFNDEEGRTHKQVLALLDRVIKRAHARRR